MRLFNLIFWQAKCGCFWILGSWKFSQNDQIENMFYFKWNSRAWKSDDFDKNFNHVFRKKYPLGLGTSILIKRTCIFFSPTCSLRSFNSVSILRLARSTSCLCWLSFRNFSSNSPMVDSCLAYKRWKKSQRILAKKKMVRVKSHYFHTVCDTYL